MKRCIDIFGAGIGLLLLLPVLVVLALLIALRLSRPVLFTILHGKSCRMLKFRSGTSACNANGILLLDDQRLALFVQRPRSTSPDETLGLWADGGIIVALGY